MITTWKLVALSLGVIMAVLLSYLPYLQESSHYTSRYTTLQLEMHNSQTQTIDRTQPSHAFMSQSERIYYDEAEQHTRFMPFVFTGIQAGQAFSGSSQQAVLSQDIFNMTEQVSLKQAKDDHIRYLSTDHLVIDWKHHLLFSPVAVSIQDGQQHTSAKGLVGNYREGWYEFAQQVQSHWE
jgi:LPS export ABC transporter protein LptC